MQRDGPRIRYFSSQLLLYFSSLNLLQGNAPAITNTRPEQPAVQVTRMLLQSAAVRSVWVMASRCSWWSCDTHVTSYEDNPRQAYFRETWR